MLSCITKKKDIFHQKLLQLSRLYAALFRHFWFLENFRVCSTDNFQSVIFSPSLVSLGHVTSRASGGEFGIRNVTLSFHITFWHLFVVFHHKIRIFIIFVSFFDEVSNSCYRILTSQKLELMIRNFQCYFIFHNKHIQ